MKLTPSFLAAGKRGGAPMPARSNRKVDQLAELFRPPYEIMQQGSFNAVQSAAEKREVWLLVNVQDDTEFDCQKLNRDVWKDAEVQKLIKSNFIFWQVRHDSPEGVQYLQIYPVARLPHVGIIDPRTGELLWFREEFLDPKSMAAESA
jgi:UBX domain-containing protein 7